MAPVTNIVFIRINGGYIMRDKEEGFQREAVFKARSTLDQQGAAEFESLISKIRSPS